ncbi:ArsR/SmtB family transcription factor [Breznakia pachnodae]|uniref:DNA-binding transcriptional ArsR family regulator n=1 Tax=Breznakia pachnodae TaxID=265178 RepID=A0ABU0E1Y6_9FIRM|nr:metalloregulator ArsR/SmtB family transcription factor [Breznakia pachnodae]MDQ0360899.1 DNA-binding transcriptional ArsR family regulator [Breznakia pachnodae]
MEKVLDQLTGEMGSLSKELDDCREIFVALGDENRQSIIMMLLKKYGGMRVGELSSHIGLSRPATSHHLRILKDARLIGMYKRGTMNFYYMGSESDRWASVIGLFSHVDKIITAFNYHSENGLVCPAKEED